MRLRSSRYRGPLQWATLVLLAATPAMHGQSSGQETLPPAPSALKFADSDPASPPADTALVAQVASTAGQSSSQGTVTDPQQAARDARDSDRKQPQANLPRPQQERMFGVLPNFVSISAGTRPKPPGWKTDFRVANRQNYDYTSIGFLLVTSGIAYGQNSHPTLNTVNGGDAIFWAYLWRGFLDKTDGSYQGTFFFPALLHEDTRYYAMGTGSKTRRTLHAVESVVVAHNYSQQPIVNVAGLMGKVGAQAVSTTYYPAHSEDFGVLASKFAYSCLRQAGFAVLREFSPDITAHLHRPGAGATATP